VRDDPGEERVRRRRLGVRVPVELVAGGLGECRDVGQSDHARSALGLVAHPQLGQGLSERVDARSHRGTGVPLPRDGGQHVGRALDSRALHVVQHRTDAAELLTAAGPPGSAVHEVRNGRSVARAAARIDPVKHQHPAVVRCDPEHERTRDIGVVSGHGRHQ